MESLPFDKSGMIVPHGEDAVLFVFPEVGSSSYGIVGKEIIDTGFNVPTGGESASLLNTIYNSKDEEFLKSPQSLRVKEKLARRLWVYERILWIPKNEKNGGAYVKTDHEVRGIEVVEVDELEDELSGGFEEKGVRFSKDGEVRFVPFKNIRLGKNKPEDLAEEGLTIAIHGVEGAEKLSKVASTLKSGATVYGYDVEYPIRKLCALSMRGHSNSLEIYGSYHNDYFSGYAFPVMKASEELCRKIFEGREKKV